MPIRYLTDPGERGVDKRAAELGVEDGHDFTLRGLSRNAVICLATPLNSSSLP